MPAREGSQPLAEGVGAAGEPGVWSGVELKESVLLDQLRGGNLGWWGDDRVCKVGDVIQKGRPWAAERWDVGRMRRNSCPVALAGKSRAWGPKSQGLHVKLYIYNCKERSSHIYNGKERGGGREWWGQRREFRSTVCSVSIFCLSDLGSISR